MILSIVMLRSLFGYSATRRASQTVQRAQRPDRPRRSRFFAALACAAPLACAAGPRPCRSPSACPAGNECLADRCVPLGAEPVDPHSQRLVLEPVAIAVVRSEGSRQSALPPTVTLGGPPGHGEQLLVRFSHAWDELDIDSAFLLLEPARDAEPTGIDVEVGVTLVAGGWTSGILVDSPASHGPTSSGLGRTRPPAVLRVDVTSQLRELAKQPHGDRGLLVRATRPSARGAIYSTGIDGTPPRLDVYLQTQRARR